MRIKTFGAATSAALAAAAMLAIPATANAADTIDFNSGVKVSVSRDAEKNITAKVDNPTKEDIQCTVGVADRDLVKLTLDLARKYKGLGEVTPSPSEIVKLQKAEEASKILGAGTINVESEKSATTPIETTKDDKSTSPEAIALCADAKGKQLVAATVAGGLIGSIDFGGSLAGNTGSVSSLDFGGSLGL